MTIEQAIQKAIEGGYQRTKRNYTPELGRFHVCEIVLDPQFWQALGKGMGWDKYYTYYRCELTDCAWSKMKEMDSVVEGYCSNCGTKRTPFQKDTQKWKYHCHQLIDHLADGGTIESYFEPL